jgi:hypothetical protein
MKLLAAFLAFCLLQGLIFSYPSWVAPGVTAVYDGISGFKTDGGYQNPIMVKMTATVDKADSSGIQATYIFQEESSGLYLPPQTLHFQPTDPVGAFWADPALLNSLKQGDTVGQYTVIGRGPVTINNKEWNAIMVRRLDESAGTSQTFTFDLSSGLLLSLTDVNVNQEIDGNFSSINIDLDKYKYSSPAGTSQPTGGGGTQQNLCGGIPLAALLIGAGYYRINGDYRIK